MAPPSILTVNGPPPTRGGSWLHLPWTNLQAVTGMLLSDDGLRGFWQEHPALK